MRLMLDEYSVDRNDYHVVGDVHYELVSNELGSDKTSNSSQKLLYLILTYPTIGEDEQPVATSAFVTIVLRRATTVHFAVETRRACYN